MTSHYIPTQSTEFIGRKDELEQIIRLITDTSHRLITLVGMGGVGKTRLAIQIGEYFLAQPAMFEKIYFVSLVSITSPDYIIEAIADGIGVKLSTAEGSQSQIIDNLKDHKILLILDNFEHVLAGRTLVEDLLINCTNLIIIATSREKLYLNDEIIYPVDGMLLPRKLTLADAEKHDAIHLFIKIAQKVDWNFKLSTDNIWQIAEICLLVDGIPLAIELSAAWLRIMSIDQIVSELHQNFDVLADSLHHVPDRHRSVQAVFEFSWQLLTDEEKEIFAQLSVFHSGFTQEAFKKIFNASSQQLLSFVDKSLIHRDINKRYTIHELLRQYAGEKLEGYPDKRDAIHDRLADYFVNFIAKRVSFFSVHGQNRSDTMHDIIYELDNIRNVWDHALEFRDFDVIDQTVDTIYYLYRIQGNYAVGFKMLNNAHDLLQSVPIDENNLPLYVKLTAMLAIYYYLVSRYDASRQYALEALDLAQQLNLPIEIARSQLALCIYSIGVGDLQQAKYYGESAFKLFESLDDIEEQTSIYINLGWTYQLLEDYPNAERLFKQLVKQHESKGNIHEMALGNIWLSLLNNLQHDYESAKIHGLKALAQFEAVNIETYATAVRKNLAIAHWGIGDYATSRSYFLEALDILINNHNLDSLEFSNIICWLPYLLHSEGNTPFALELSAFILNIPHVHYEAQKTVREIYPTLKAELSDVVFETAQFRGQISTFDEIFKRTYAYLKSEPHTKLNSPTLSNNAIITIVEDALKSSHMTYRLNNKLSQEIIASIAVEIEALLESEKSKMIAKFMESTSHDLRTPIAVINSSLYILEHVKDPDRRNQKMQVLKQQVQHLHDVIENLLLMSRLDNGIDFELSTFDLVSLIRGIHAQTQQRADESQIQLDLNIITQPLIVHADMSYLQDAFVQLLDNAFEHTPAVGHIMIECYEKDNHAIISISDTGGGIDKRHLPFVFDRFYRVDFARTTAGKSGLGLAIVKSITEAHHGTCTVTSTPQHGSTFTIHLPLV